jgi:hypothetical protein
MPLSDPPALRPESIESVFARVGRIHEGRRADIALAQALDRLARWQSARLRQTYADLAVQARYRDAVRFFQADLYGGADYAQRDADLARVVPAMRRMLPAGVVATIAEAMEANVLAYELDRALLGHLPCGASRLTVAEYCHAYRAMGCRAERERQIALIHDIGSALDRYVHKPLVVTALKVMRRPARAAGFSVLHDFLERGFIAFSRMNGAGEFLAAVVARETALMETIYGGDDAPFLDPFADAAGATPAQVLPFAGLPKR